MAAKKGAKRKGCYCVKWSKKRRCLKRAVPGCTPKKRKTTRRKKK